MKRAAASIEELLKGLDAQQVERPLEVKTAEGAVDFQRLLSRLETYLDYPDKPTWEEDFTRTYGPCDDELTPAQIDEFLQMTAALEQKPTYLVRTGYFVSRLIGNSSRAGNREFTLNLEQLEKICWIGQINGTEESPVTVTIDGKIGNNCGRDSTYANISTTEAGDHYGFRADHSTLTAEKIGSGSGFQAKHSTLTAHEAGDDCGRLGEGITVTVHKAGHRFGGGAYNSTFTAYEVGDECGSNGAKNSTYRTTNPETFAQMLESVSRDRGNKVVFIRKDGTEEVSER